MANEDVKQSIRDSGVKLWQVADALNISDSTFSKKLRKEFSDEVKQKIANIIQDLSEGNRG